MPDLLYLLSKWWKQIFFIVLLSVLVTGIIVFLKPKKYLSTATAVPASTVASDKARIFNENIESLYSDLGSSDDLDVIIGTGQLDTIYLAVTDQFNLYDHYKINGEGDAARRKAALLLKKNTRVLKSDYRELKIKVWDTDKNLAPQLANALMSKLQAIHQDIQNETNAATLSGLKTGMQKIKDSLNRIKSSMSFMDNISTDTTGRIILMNQLQKYQQLISEYQLMVDSKSPSLLVVENARPAICADKPKRWEIIFATAILSLLFSFLVALVLEKRKISQQ